MNRRTLIRNLLSTLPAGLLAPVFLQSCRKDLVPGDIKFNGEVVIVGAGIAGLYAARLLDEYGIPYRILEASNRTGGRIRSESGFADFEVETGAFKINGQRSVFYDLLERYASQPAQRIDQGAYYLFENQLRDEEFIRTSGSLAGRGETLFQLIDSLGSYPGNAQSFQQYLQDFPVSSSLFDIANSLVGNAYGADNASLGMFSLRDEASAQSAGNFSYMLPEDSFSSILNSAFAAQISRTELGQVVNSIDSTSSKVVVTTQQGNSIQADAVIVCVPLSVLKNGYIEFVPSLPVEKTQAIQKIGFGKALTVNLKFNAAFWDEDASVIYGGSVAPEYRILNKVKNGSTFVLTAYICGQAAESLQQISDSEKVQSILAELSGMYAGNDVGGKFSGQYIVKDWGEEDYILGGVSYPTPGAEGQRPALQKDIAGKLFFAGEACNTNGHAGTVHGAMETAFEAVNKLLTI